MQKITEIFTWQNYKVEELEKTHKTFDDLPNIFAQAVNDWESEVDVKPTEIFFIGADAELIKIK